MSDCNGSVTPKLDKSCIDGDNEELSEEQATRFRSAVLTLLYLSNERTDLQRTVRLLCTKLKSPTALENETVEETFEIHQKQRRHVNSVWDA